MINHREYQMNIQANSLKISLFSFCILLFISVSLPDSEIYFQPSRKCYAASLPRSGTSEKWGYVSPEILARTCCPVDTTAAAAVIFDIGTIFLNRIEFAAEETHRVRLQLFSEDAKKYATVKIPYWFDDGVYSIKAQTILPNGKKIPLKKKEIREEGDKDAWMYKVFTLPGVEKNCVIEYQYKCTTKHLAVLEPWEFQCSIPTELSRITITLSRGFIYHFYIENRGEYSGEPVKEEGIDINTQEKIYSYIWEYKNLPSITDEPYITTLRDYMMILKFQLEQFVDPYNHITFVSTWEDVRKRITEAHKLYLRTPKIVRDMADEIAGEETSRKEKTHLIYNYVRDNIGSDQYQGTTYEIQDPQEVIRNKKGDRIEKNLLLLSVLRAADIEADPVLLRISQFYHHER